jgi:predicted Zn-ribbon and HTH transcriptional regulator
MKPTKNLNTLKRRYARLGVTVTKTVVTTDGYLVADGFRCCKCGMEFFPDAVRVRIRHRCPNGCKPGTSAEQDCLSNVKG